MKEGEGLHAPTSSRPIARKAPRGREGRGGGEEGESGGERARGEGGRRDGGEDGRGEEVLAAGANDGDGDGASDQEEPKKARDEL